MVKNKDFPNVIDFGRHFAVINPEGIYDYLDGTITGAQVLKMDFSFITDWFDQKLLCIDLKLWNRIPPCYHPEVFASLRDEQEESPYWGIDIYDQLKVYKRLKRNYETDALAIKALSKPFDITTRSGRNKLSLLRKSIAKHFYIETFAASKLLKLYMAQTDTSFLNHPRKQILIKLEEFQKELLKQTKAN
jgi:hypothetical protein